MWVGLGGALPMEFWLEDGSADASDYGGEVNHAGATAWTLNASGAEASSANFSFPVADDSVAETTESFKIHVRVVGHPETEMVLEADILSRHPNDGRRFPHP